MITRFEICAIIRSRYSYPINDRDLHHWVGNTPAQRQPVRDIGLQMQGSLSILSEKEGHETPADFISWGGT
jgi:hypothetical protein